jgi:hypothetical protein
MVTPRYTKLDDIRQGVVPLTGGVNEAVTTLALKAGELLQCENYTEIDGPYAGYSSVGGYEVFDGTELASEVNATLTSTDPDTGIETWDDVARELRRAETLPIPGEGQARGVHQYLGDVFGARDFSVTKAKMYIADAVLGWDELLATDMNAGGNCRFVNENFAKYPTAPLADYPPVMTNKEIMLWVDGVSKPHSWDGTVVRVIDDINLPSNDAFLPAPVYPTHIAAFDNRLFLAFPGGHLFFSELGNPGSWDGANGAGAIPTGGEITDIINGPGNTLIIFMRNSISILYVLEDLTLDFPFQLKEFSNRSGAIADTGSRMLGDIYFVDDRGPTSLEAVDAFGDFAQNTPTRKTQRTFLINKPLVTTAVSRRDVSQYRLFFSDKTAMYFTYHNKKVKGAGYIRFKHAVRRVTESEDKEGFTAVYFIADDDDGYVYKMDSGTSFNGEAIRTHAVTAYHNYGSSRSWKHFIDLLFEMSADNGTKIMVSTDYDYADVGFPRNPTASQKLSGLGGIWGRTAVWGFFIWGGAYIQRPIYYIYGYGTNMSVAIRTEEKYRSQHIIHNFITDYSLHDRRL